MNALERVLQMLKGNRRLRVGCALIVLILAADALLAAQDRIDLERQSLAVDAKRLGRLEAIAAEPRWVAAAEQASRSLVAARRLAWTEETEGLMEAQLRDWVTGALAAQSIQPQSLSVRLEPPAPAGSADALPDDVRLVRATLELQVPPSKLVDLFASLGAAPHLVWVDRANLNFVEGQRHASLELVGLFRVGKPETAS
jgi:hypothetical protein